MPDSELNPPNIDWEEMDEMDTLDSGVAPSLPQLQKEYRSRDAAPVFPRIPYFSDAYKPWDPRRLLNHARYTDTMNLQCPIRTFYSHGTFLWSYSQLSLGNCLAFRNGNIHGGTHIMLLHLKSTNDAFMSAL
ncbi:hypothetical protein M422DRAFT_274466 [Sphaerobolus stellatus SS14]|uniref:Uncharacterized protein n=1 Tax=Sphaerobolus stellatus (strain SS14) TaxID=990650 RepID=A0A0C9U6F4_SPHS4|nr:hypothetical protein M422DRAFT_274466 [Sphaerobolus stellatus SS14]